MRRPPKGPRRRPRLAARLNRVVVVGTPGLSVSALTYRPASPRSIEDAVLEVKRVVDALQKALHDMEEVLELIEDAEQQKVADEREVQRLQDLLRQMTQPRAPLAATINTSPAPILGAQPGGEPRGPRGQDRGRRHGRGRGRRPGPRRTGGGAGATGAPPGASDASAAG